GFPCIDFGEGNVANHAGFYSLYQSQSLDQSFDLSGSYSRRAGIGGFAGISADISFPWPRGVKGER
ncbi:hypothetical protein ABTL87_19235, partial [Acinetobacter baumannii]